MTLCWVSESHVICWLWMSLISKHFHGSDLQLSLSAPLAIPPIPHSGYISSWTKWQGDPHAGSLQTPSLIDTHSRSLKRSYTHTVHKHTHTHTHTHFWPALLIQHERRAPCRSYFGALFWSHSGAYVSGIIRRSEPHLHLRANSRPD